MTLSGRIASKGLRRECRKLERGKNPILPRMVRPATLPHHQAPRLAVAPAAGMVEMPVQVQPKHKKQPLV